MEGIDEAPGNVTQIVSIKLLTVNLFRLFELTNKIAALSLFQLATRPFGVYLAASIDSLAIGIMILISGGQLQFTLPCVFALMNPILETHNAVTLPHSWYYILRAVELLTMGGVVLLLSLYSLTMTERITTITTIVTTMITTIATTILV